MNATMLNARVGRSFYHVTTYPKVLVTLGLLGLVTTGVFGNIFYRVTRETVSPQSPFSLTTNRFNTTSLRDATKDRWTGARKTMMQAFEILEFTSDKDLARRLGYTADNRVEEVSLIRTLKWCCCEKYFLDLHI